ncbi:helix-turn-helix domain-containing protein, partial [Clostridium tetani]
MKNLETIISNKEVKRRTNIRTNKHHKAKRRNEKRLTKRQQEKMEKIKKIEELRKLGLKQKEIADRLGVAKSLVSMYMKELK